MGEAEYNSVLAAVSTAMQVVVAPRDFPDDDEDFMVVPVAANDNDGPWPHLPFPEGWTASC